MPRAAPYPPTLAPTLALALTTDPNPNPNQVPNAESSLSVGFTSLRDGKALWLILTPKDGGTMQARTHAHTMHAPMHAPCTHHAHPMRHTMRHTMQARTEDARVCGGRAVGVRWACGVPGAGGPVSLHLEQLAEHRIMMELLGGRAREGVRPSASRAQV